MSTSDNSHLSASNVDAFSCSAISKELVTVRRLHVVTSSNPVKQSWINWRAPNTILTTRQIPFTTAVQPKMVQKELHWTPHNVGVSIAVGKNLMWSTINISKEVISASKGVSSATLNLKKIYYCGQLWLQWSLVYDVFGVPFTGSSNECQSAQGQPESQLFTGTCRPSASTSISFGDLGAGVRYVSRIVNSTFTLGDVKSPTVLKAWKHEVKETRMLNQWLPRCWINLYRKLDIWGCHLVPEADTLQINPYVPQIAKNGRFHNSRNHTLNIFNNRTCSKVTITKY